MPQKIVCSRKYLDFIRYAVSMEEQLPDSCKEIDWKGLYKFCSQQGVLGVAFQGIERSNLRIPQSLLFEWLGTVERIKATNQLTNQCMLKVTRFFEKSGRRSCILKGQANALMYPRPELRSPGDIDIWVEGQREEIIKIVLKETPNAHYSIHHIKMPIFKEVSVEVHYRPIYLSNWFLDKKLQRYISSNENRQFLHRVNIDQTTIGSLTNDFNVVYQLLHMHAHFFTTRNNLKQFVDYFYLLKETYANSESYKKETRELFKEFGVLKYASGIMWVMKEILGLEDKYLVVEPSEKEGRLIFNEALYFGTWSNNKLHSVIEQFVANARILGHYPKDVLIGPLFLIWHQWLKIKIKWALKK